MLQSLKVAIANAKVDALAEMLASDYAKRSLAALAAGIGETEEATAAILAECQPHAVRTTGRRTGKVYYSISG